MGGRACIRGMRIPVSVIVGQIAHGATFAEVLEGFPTSNGRTSSRPSNTRRGWLKRKCTSRKTPARERIAMRAAIAFDRTLQKLFTDRTHWLRAQVRTPKRGKAPGFNKKKVEKSIEKLKALATRCLLRGHAIDGLNQLYDLKKQWHVSSGKGRGVDEKRKAFAAWFGKSIHYKNCVYVFWAKRRCRYVGRTLKGKNRPHSHFEKWWFPGVTRVDVYAARGKKNISKLECLTTHRFQPVYSKIKPSGLRWNTRCPICELHREIRSEVKSTFRLR